MNGLNFEISFVGLAFSIVVRIIAAVFYGIVIRKALREVEVKNGLIKLRIQLLVSAIVLEFINTAGMILLLIRPFISLAVFKASTDSLSFLNSTGFLIVAFLLYRIYTQQYTPEQIERHEKIAKQEAKERKT